MHLLKRIVIVVCLATLVADCGARAARLEQARQLKETVEQELARLQVPPPHETYEDQEIRERAVEILKDRLAEISKAEKQEKESPAQGQARREIEKRHRDSEKFAKRQANALAHVNVVGCPPGSVGVNLREAAYFGNFFYSANVRIVNDSTCNFRFSTSARGMSILVSNLCQRGEVSIGFPLTVGEYAKNIPIVATPQSPECQIQATTLQIYRNDYESQQSGIWVIR